MVIYNIMPFVVKVDKSFKPPKYRLYNKQKKVYVNKLFKSRETAKKMAGVYERYADKNNVVIAQNK